LICLLNEWNCTRYLNKLDHKPLGRSNLLSPYLEDSLQNPPHIWFELEQMCVCVFYSHQKHEVSSIKKVKNNDSPCFHASSTVSLLRAAIEVKMENDLSFLHKNADWVSESANCRELLNSGFHVVGPLLNLTLGLSSQNTVKRNSQEYINAGQAFICFRL